MHRWDSGGFGKCTAGLQDSGSLGLRRDQCEAMGGEWQGMLVANHLTILTKTSEGLLGTEPGGGSVKKKIERTLHHYVRH